MEILRTIAMYAESKGMRFLVIGGHAANAYGISRQTGDLDLLIPIAEKERWVELLTRLKYTKNQDDCHFMRFSPDQIAAWPIDLMLIDEKTFEKLWSDSEIKTIGLAEARLVSARHLVTLKIHALKNYQQHRFAKDFNDVLLLIRSKQTGLTDEELRAICERYASLELYDKFKREL